MPTEASRAALEQRAEIEVNRRDAELRSYKSGMGFAASCWLTGYCAAIADAAKVCDAALARVKANAVPGRTLKPYYQGEGGACEDLAAAIRALADPPAEQPPREKA